MNIEINTLNPKFDSRETYLAWRNAWRAEYKQQSQLIRDTKKMIREAHRSGGEAGPLQSTLHYQRLQANALMNARRVGKELMLEQRAAALAAAA